MTETRGKGKRGRTEGDAVEITPKIAVDPDLVCTICLDLVVDARQVSCCGSLFCKLCIQSCLSRSATENCPSCRSSLDTKKIVIDKRSDRKSADHPRNCPYHEEYHCSFVGNRSTILAHKNACRFNPTICQNEYCRALHARQSAREQNHTDENLLIRRKLVESAWQTPEEILRTTYNLTKVKFFKVRMNKEEYRLKFDWGTSSYVCTIKCAHHNVSIMCSSAGYYSESGLQGKFVLIHPSDPLLNRTVEIVVPARREMDEESDEEDADFEFDEEGEDDEDDEEFDDDEDSDSDSDDDIVQEVEVIDVDNMGHGSEEEDEEEEEDDEEGDEGVQQEFGEVNWMTQREFKEFAKDGKFAMGVEALPYE